MSETTTTKPKYNNEDEIGVLWTKQGQSQKYLSGVLKLKNFGIDKEINIVVFVNKNKQQDNHPDYRILLSKPKDAPAASAPKTAAKPVAKSKPAPAPEPEEAASAESPEDPFL